MRARLLSFGTTYSESQVLSFLGWFSSGSQANNFLKCYHLLAKLIGTELFCYFVQSNLTTQLLLLISLSPLPTPADHTVDSSQANQVRSLVSVIALRTDQFAESRLREQFLMSFRSTNIFASQSAFHGERQPAFVPSSTTSINGGTGWKGSPGTEC